MRLRRAVHALAVLGVSAATVAVASPAGATPPTRPNWPTTDGGVSTQAAICDPNFDWWWSVTGDWDGDGVDSAGIITQDVSTGALTWHLKNANADGPADITFVYGTSALGDFPIAGDWDGDGIDTVGVQRDAGQALWLLKNTNDGSSTDVRFTYGRWASDFPVVGDWDGDGADTVAAVRSRTWLLKNSLTGGVADRSFTYGAGTLNGDFPVAADWDATGTDTPGVIRGSNTGRLHWLLRNSTSSGPAEISYSYGLNSDLVAFGGDWNADGADGPGLVRDVSEWLFRNANSSGVADFDYCFG